MSAEPDEARLLARARSADPDALAELFERFGQVMHDVAFRITRSGDDAADVLQDVFVGLPEALRGYEATGSLEWWLRRLTARTALLGLRRAKRRARWEKRAARLKPATEPPDPVEARLVLERVLGRMPEDLRAVYTLKEVEGYSHAEIAGILSITVAASEVRLHRARRFLRDRLRGKI